MVHWLGILGVIGKKIGINLVLMLLIYDSANRKINDFYS